MKDFAALIIVGLFLMATVADILFTMTDVAWKVEQSPTTGLCYEVYTRFTVVGAGMAMNRIDNSHCEERS